MSEDIGGVWRTIGGRRVFIRNGVDLKTAMIESGKFKRVKKDEGYTKDNVEFIEDGKSNYLLHNGEKIEFLKKKEYDTACANLNDSLGDEERRVLNWYVDAPFVAGSAELNELNERNINGYEHAKDKPSHTYLENNRADNILTEYELDKKFIDVYYEQGFPQINENTNEWTHKVWETQKNIVGMGDYAFTNKAIEERKNKIAFFSKPENIQALKEAYALKKQVDDEKEKFQNEHPKYWQDAEYDKIGKEINERVQQIVEGLNNKNDFQVEYENRSSGYYRGLVDYAERKNQLWRSDEEINNAKRLNIKQMIDRYKVDGLSTFTEDVREEISGTIHTQQDIDRIFNEKGITFDKDIILFRRTRESKEEIKEGFTKYGYISTTYKDSLPKKMPSGLPFGDKELEIIIPKGTKVLPLRGVIESRLTGDKDADESVRGVARQNEVLLPRQSYFKYITYDWKTGRYVVVLEGGNK